jgi:hypothetical protein
MHTTDCFKPCSKCNGNNFGIYTSSRTGKSKLYCRDCQRNRRDTYNNRKLANGGGHTRKQWLDKLAQYACCPHCGRGWQEIPARPNKRYGNRTWTKDHIIPVSKGGKDDIDNIQPLCYQCQFKKNNKDEIIPQK